METPRPITDQEIVEVTRACGYTATPPKGSDIYYTFRDSEHCFLIATPAWLRQQVTAKTLPALLEAERAKPRFYR